MNILWDCLWCPAAWCARKENWAIGHFLSMKPIRVLEIAGHSFHFQTRNLDTLQILIEKCIQFNLKMFHLIVVPKLFCMQWGLKYEGCHM